MISVIMPCYNAAKYISEAIESVQSQTYSDWELIIVDDGSIDNSVDIVQHLIANSDSKKKIEIVCQQNAGACRARNNGLVHAHGEFIKFLDADDCLEPTCLEKQIAQIVSLENNQIPVGGYLNTDEEGNVVSTFSLSPKMVYLLESDPVSFFFENWEILISSPLHRREYLIKINGFDESLQRGQEFDLHFRLALSGVQFRYFSLYTFKYRNYVSPYRISSQSKNHNQDSLNRNIKFERLLLEYYDDMPANLATYFSREWFSKAREKFSQKNLEDGIYWLQKAQLYQNQDLFQKLYVVVGRLIGFLNIEYILRLRLKILSKNGND